MKNSIYLAILIYIFSFASSVANAETIKRDPINYTIILDLSDRVLNPNQLSYDIEQIKVMFSKFKQKAKQNLIITSKDRFIVKIIPQNNSPLNIDYFENALQLRLDQISIKDKNNRLNQLDKQFSEILQKLESEALYGNKSSDYAGVDLWAFMNENKENMTFPNYENTIIILTDGYLDFENNNHVMKIGNQYTSTKFINTLNMKNWKEDVKEKNYGIIPIKINVNANWVISGIKSKYPNDLMQINKLKYFWSKWINESANATPKFINYSTKSQIVSELNSIIN
ncbi:hypothetical protein [Hwangdonia sp.]|uniref:hypothetical protein n=1 Tax=Hwangdonia sp. TaxID=1883432 RepID=UPI003AB5E3AB